MTHCTLPLYFLVKKLGENGIPAFLMSSQDNHQVNDADFAAIIAGRYRAVFMSPEILFGIGSTCVKVGNLWRNTSWRNQLISIVVDEIHCSNTWAGFRQYYTLIGTLRGKAPGVLIIGLTATLPPEDFLKVKKSVYLSSSDVKLIRVYDIRENIRLEVHTFSSQGHIRQLAGLLNKTKTIVYFDKTKTLREVQEGLRPLRPDLSIDAFFSTRYPIAKDEAMRKFIDSETDVLLATDACGMGCDISDVITVIQYE